jgi:hypothetical protein
MDNGEERIAEATQKMSLASVICRCDTPSQIIFFFSLFYPAINLGDCQITVRSGQRHTIQLQIIS